ncbi:MAG: Hpt domain-containing protein [Cyclobacteriaceae bacterium]
MTAPNLSTIHKMSQGDREFEKKILSVAKVELQEEVKAFNKAIELVDYLQAAQLVHKIKHKISLLGMEESYNLAAAFEAQLNDKTESLLPDFRLILEKMITFLEESE